MHIGDTVADVMAIRSQVKAAITNTEHWADNDILENVVAQYTQAAIQMEIMNMLARMKDGV